MKKIILFFILVSSGMIYSQTWNSINFKNPTLNALDTEIEHSIKDASNNVYTKEINSYNNLNTNVNVLSKYNSSNTLLWSKNVVHANLPTNAGNISNKIQLNGSDIYLGSLTTANRGIIVKTPNSNSQSYTTWELLGGTATSNFTDFKIIGNDLYAIGYFSSYTNLSKDVIFNSTLSKTVPANKTYSFIAKYTVSPKQLVWVKVIESSNYVTAQNIELDSSNNFYISGKYSTSATFYNGATQVPFNSGNQNTVFLAKFNSNGDFTTSFGLKQNYPAYNTFSVKVDSNNVLYSSDNDIHSYTVSGSLNWERAVPTLGTIYDIETNTCGDVIASGDSYEDVAKGASFAPDHQNFFGIMLNKNNGNTMWVSNATNNANRGKKVLTYSDGSVKFLGDFHGQGITISSFSATTQMGVFFAKLNIQNVNSCCDYSLNLGSDIVICQGQSVPSVNILNQGFNNTDFVINWLIDGHVAQHGGLVFNPTGVTNGSVVQVQITSTNCEVVYADSITITIIQPIVIDLYNTYYNCNNNELELCGPIAPAGTTYNYMWAMQNNPLVFAQGQCFTPLTPGNYVLTVSDTNGCSSATHNFTVLNQLPELELGHDIVICEGQKMPIISIAHQGFDNSNAVITWYHNGIVVQNGGTVLQYSPTSGSVSVSVSIPGCHKQIDQIEITVKKCCPEDVQIGIILCPGREPIFNILNQGYDDPNVTITWFFNGNVIQNGGEILEMSMYGNGEITVVISKEGCRKISDSIKISCDKDVYFPHKKEIETIKDTSFEIYPNPTSDIVNFVFSENQTGKIEIYSLDGKIVFSEELKNSSQANADIGQYQDGIYIARITTGDKTINKKIIKK